MKYKTVEYSYPTSPNAEKLGFGKTGCWTVETRENLSAPKAIVGFSKKRDAVAYAETMKEPWCPIYLWAQNK